LALKDSVLEKVYRANALKLLQTRAPVPVAAGSQ